MPLTPFHPAPRPASWDLLEKPNVGLATTLLAECKQLPSFWQVSDGDESNVRVMYRIEGEEEFQLGVTDLHGRNRWEGVYETFMVAIGERLWKWKPIPIAHLADRLHNFRWLFVNIDDGRFVAEPSLNGILDATEFQMDDAIVYASN